MLLPSRRIGALMFAAFALLVVAGRSVAEPSLLVAPELAGRSVTVGDSLSLRIQLPPALGAEEYELYLSLDGGRNHHVRLTRERDTSDSQFAIRIPNLPTRDARIVVRAGRRQNPGAFERDVALSPFFEIAASSGAVDQPLPIEAKAPHAEEPGISAGDDDIEWWVSDEVPPEVREREPLLLLSLGSVPHFSPDPIPDAGPGLASGRPDPGTLNRPLAVRSRSRQPLRAGRDISRVARPVAPLTLTLRI
jgi:hypothetical protein